MRISGQCPVVSGQSFIVVKQPLAELGRILNGLITSLQQKKASPRSLATGR